MTSLLWVDYMKYKIQFTVGAEIYLVTITSTVALEPNRPLTQWEPRLLIAWVKWLENEAARLPPSGTKLMKDWKSTYPPPHIFIKINSAQNILTTSTYYTGSIF